jgi:four helix bundle protein
VNRVELEARTKAFAVRVIRLVGDLPRNRAADVLGHQLLRSGTSIGANYREAARAESRNDFIHKIGLVEKEAAETVYWLELLEAAGLGEVAERQALRQEAGELLAIFTATGRTAKSNHNNSQSEIRNPRSKPNPHSAIWDQESREDAR